MTLRTKGEQKAYLDGYEMCAACIENYLSAEGKNMTLEEAIKHCEEVADTPCFTDEEARCYSEHRQLAEWLTELKAYRKQSDDEELDFVPEHKKIPCTLIIKKE